MQKRSQKNHLPSELQNFFNILNIQNLRIYSNTKSVSKNETINPGLADGL